MKNKSGLSAVVTNLIIILLVIVAVGIIWLVVSNLISDTNKGINLEGITEKLEIKKVTFNETADLVSVQVYRASGEENLTAIRFVVYDSNGDSQSFDESVSINEFDTKTISVSGYTGTEVTKVEVAPIITSEDGSSDIKEITDEYVLADYE